MPSMDFYASPDSQTDAAIHGPDRLKEISPAAFVTKSPREAEAILASWL